jgi:hypothetical protein
VKQNEPSVALPVAQARKATTRLVEKIARDDERPIADHFEMMEDTERALLVDEALSLYLPHRFQSGG